jgi:hypothetical protein
MQMPKTDVTDNLPAPLSLTLEEASKIAAGSSGLVLSSVETWWWKGQPAFAILNPGNLVTGPSPVLGGLIAAH